MPRHSRGSAHGAALSGPAFSDKWSQQPALNFEIINKAEMPPGEAHSLIARPAARHHAVRDSAIQSCGEDSHAGKLRQRDLAQRIGEVPDAVEFSAAG